ncbi:RICIN domain-containing protein [Streptomyces sp. NPDC056580]|uniref:RICIN domain-containing protein n=1 Tax=Streptomyces sp. NPDC056580 TaxID=3345872 RepID=UPI003679FF46
MATALGATLLGASMAFTGSTAGAVAPAPPATVLQHVTGAADNVYYIKNQHSGKCMTVHGASTAKGARIDQYRCISGAQNQWWVVYKLHSNGLVRVTGYQSGKCLSILGGSKRKGAPLVQWTCNGAGDQLFVGHLAFGGKTAIKSYRSGKCLDVQGASTGNNAPIIQWSCNGGTNQKWYLTG